MFYIYCHVRKNSIFLQEINLSVEEILIKYVIFHSDFTMIVKVSINLC